MKPTMTKFDQAQYELSMAGSHFANAAIAGAQAVGVWGLLAGVGYGVSCIASTATTFATLGKAAVFTDTIASNIATAVLPCAALLQAIGETAVNAPQEAVYETCYGANDLGNAMYHLAEYGVEYLMGAHSASEVAA